MDPAFARCTVYCPLSAATLPGVPTANTDKNSASEPDVEQKRAAYAALADVLANDSARQELIDQLRKAAATPPPDSTPTLTPPAVKEETTVLENVTQISREYGEQLSSRFSQLWRNITGSPHKPFNPQTFTSAAWHFLLLAGLVFAFWWLVRLAALPLYRKMGEWGRHKNRDRGNWLQLPLTIAGAFIIDLLLLALTLFVGQLLSDRLNGNNPTIAFQQSLFLNAFALIEFFKAILRLIFCPRIPALRPFNLSDEAASYWSLRLSALSSLIGYGLIVAVPIISNQVNVQVGALANVVIMLCITLWALYLIFHNKAVITQGLIHWPTTHSLSLACLSAPSRWSGTGWPAPTLWCFFLFPFRPGQQPEIHDGRHPAKPGDYRRRGAGVWHPVALDSQNHHPVARHSAQLS